MLPNLSHSSSSTMAHVPVMPVEVADLLEPRPGDTIVDCTFGAGGHAARLEPLLRGSGTYLAIDRDASVGPFYERFAASATANTCSTFVGFNNTLTAAPPCCTRRSAYLASAT